MSTDRFETSPRARAREEYIRWWERVSTPSATQRSEERDYNRLHARMHHRDVYGRGSIASLVRGVEEAEAQP